MMLNWTKSFVIEGSRALFRAEAINTAQEPALVASLPSDGSFKTYPNSAYCSLSPDTQYVNLILGDSPLPYDRDVEFAVGAFFVKVPQGERMTTDIRLAVPLQEWSGYSLPSPLIETKLVHVRKVVLHIDVVAQSAVTWMRAARAAADHYSVEGRFARYSLEFYLDAPLSVKKRMDDFPRP